MLFARLSRLDVSTYADRSVAETMHRLLGEGSASRLGHALVRLSIYGNDPEFASGDAGIRQLQLALSSGVRYIDGEWQTITDSLLKVAADRGVMLQTGAKIDASALDELRGEHRAVVIAAGGPKVAATLLGESVAAAADWSRAARPATVASLDIGLAAPWGAGPPFALGIDEPLYLSVHGPVARLAPAGHTLVHVSRYQHPDELDDPERDRERCEAFIDRVRPGWRDDATHVRFQRKLVAATDQPRVGGGGIAGRPAVGVTDEPGLFIAGDWVGSEGLLADASVASGRRAGLMAAT
jgi:phytoene dehydrogenase-like protein